MNKNTIEYFESSYDRSIYDLETLKSSLNERLHKLTAKADKNNDIFISYTDKNGDKWEARTWQDLQDSYACDLISMKKFDKLAETLEKKKTYLQNPTVIYQIEQEIRLLENIIKEILEAKERNWPLV